MEELDRLGVTKWHSLTVQLVELCPQLSVSLRGLSLGRRARLFARHSLPVLETKRDGFRVLQRPRDPDSSTTPTTCPQIGPAGLEVPRTLRPRTPATARQVQPVRSQTACRIPTGVISTCDELLDSCRLLTPCRWCA